MLMFVTQNEVRWTIFDNIKASSAHVYGGTWPEVVSLLTSEKIYPSKETCPLFKGGVFGVNRTQAGSLRSDENLQEVWLIEGDYDGGEISVQLALEALESHQIRALIVTTANHTNEKPRWRVIAPLSSVASPADRYRLVARLNGALGGILASESFTASQAYYFGRVQGASFDFVATFGDLDEGHCIDQLIELDQISIGRREQERIEPDTGEISTDSIVDESVLAEKVALLERKLRTGDGRREMLKSIAASLSAKYQTAHQINVTLRRICNEYFDPYDPVDWSNIDRLVSDIVAKDSERTEKIAATFGPLLEKIREGKAAEVTIRKSSTNWVQALKDFRPPRQTWHDTPPVRWAVEGLIRAGTVGVLVAPGATGKTTLMITLGICHALGTPFMGHQVQQGGFLLLSLDDGQDDLDAAVGLVMKAMQLQEQDVEQVARYLRVLSLQGRDGPRTFNLPGTPGQLDPRMMQAFREACTAVPKLVGVCVDTLRQFAGGPTNDEQTIMVVSSACANLAQESGAYFMIPHHTGKQQARDDAGDMYAGSGSAAIADNARFLFVLSEVKKRTELSVLDPQVQQDQNSGDCKILRLSSRRGSIRHKAKPDLLIVRRGFLMHPAVVVRPDCSNRLLQILTVIHDLSVSGTAVSKNKVYEQLKGNKQRTLAEIDDLIYRDLVAVDASNGAGNSPKLVGLTASGSALLSSLTNGSAEVVPP
jgi:hypothetical protein